VETLIRLYTAGTKEDYRDFDNFRKLIYKRTPTTKYRFQVIDVLKYPETAKKDGVVVIPTVICKF